jgi:hypothetical protein
MPFEPDPTPIPDGSGSPTAADVYRILASLTSDSDVEAKLDDFQGMFE